MELSVLLSGLIGALIGSIVSSYYLEIAQQRRLRVEVLMEIVDYCDEIYNRLEIMHAHIERVYTGKPAKITQEEYNTNSRELSELVKSSRPHVKLEAAYGFGPAVWHLDWMREAFQKAMLTLAGATQESWADEGIKVQTLFSKQIDPMRAKVQAALINGTKLRWIAIPTFSRVLAWIRYKVSTKTK